MKVRSLSLREIPCQSSTPFNKYNLFTFDDVIQSNVNCEGRGTIAGNTSLANFEVGNILSLLPLYSPDDTLVVTGNLNWNNGSNFAGNTVIPSNPSSTTTSTSTKVPTTTQVSNTPTSTTTMTPSTSTTSSATATSPCLCCVKGLIWRDCKQNKYKDSFEKVLPNVQVKLYNSEGKCIRITKSNLYGIYKFNNVSPGEYHLVFTNTSNLTHNFIRTCSFVLNPGNCYTQNISI